MLQSLPVFNREERECALELFEISAAGPAEEGYHSLVAESEQGELLGFICFGEAALAERVGEIYWVVVSPQQQRCGVGSRLLAEVERQLKSNGVRMLVVETSSRAEYLAAQRFYENCGYRLAARLPKFYRPDDDKLIYLKELL
jgi:ribosomal protein S18 acetylase RimI-like enzyme